VRAARDLGACCISPDASLPAEENVELLLRALRLVQLGLEVQVADNEGLLQESNALREDARVRRGGSRRTADAAEGGCARLPAAAPCPADKRLVTGTKCWTGANMRFLRLQRLACSFYVMAISACCHLAGNPSPYGTRNIRPWRSLTAPWRRTYRSCGS
jgi:hypothetical protein